MDPFTRDFMNKKFNAGIKNFDDLAWDFELHEWQKAGFENVLTRCNRSDEHNAIAVNACVGSGKTFFASLATADYIDHHRNEKTIQLFVTPRIKLCHQQRNEFIDKISTCGPYNYQKFTEFPGNTDYQIIPVDCTHREWNRHNDHLDAQHAIFTVCAESLWGETKNNNSGQRWNDWMCRIKKWEEAGYKIGNIIFDEAHNFKNDEKVKKMFGTTHFKKKKKNGNGVNDISIDYIKNECLLTHFQNVILLSGTPAAYQKDITSAFPKNVCECPLNVAIKKGWVEYPILNLVCIEASDLFSTGIIKVLEHEVNVVKPVNGVRLLVNFGSIPEIDEFENDPYIKDHMDKDFHFITIHSDVDFKNNDLTSRKCKSMVNGIPYDSSDIYDLLEGIDSGFTDNEKMQSVLNLILDGKPIMVGQVAMISEGINIKSFNSVITKSNSDTTATQQIGRVLRKYKKGNNEKHYPNVYCVFDNVSSLTKLLGNLMYEHSLTADCFEWGKRIDITGNGYSTEDDDDDDELKERSKIGWFKIDPNNDPDIFEIQYSDEFQNIKFSKNLKEFTDDDKFDDLLEQFGSFFTASDTKMLLGDLKRTNAIHGHSKITKGKNKRKKKADVVLPAPVMNDKPVSDVATNHVEIIIQDQDERKEEETVSTNVSNEFLFELIRTVRGWILHHQKNAKLIKNTKEHPEYLIEMLFSYVPELAKKIIDSGICKYDKFISLIGLK